MSEWQPIETAPKDGIILSSWGCTMPSGRPFCWWLEESNWQGEGECWSLTDERHQAHTGRFPATHWMPLHAPPAPEQT
jgi:hypothetical protein